MEVGGGGWHRWRGGGMQGQRFFFAFNLLATTHTMHNFPQKDPANVRRSCMCLFCIRLRRAAEKKAVARARRVWDGVGVRPVLHARPEIAGEVYVKSCRDLNMDLACSEALRSRRPR